MRRQALDVRQPNGQAPLITRLVGRFAHPNLQVFSGKPRLDLRRETHGAGMYAPFSNTIPLMSNQMSTTLYATGGLMRAEIERFQWCSCAKWSKFAPKKTLSLEESMPDRREFEKLSVKTDRTPEPSLTGPENAKRLRA